MNAKELCNSIYLGDRYCKKMEIKGNKILFQINCISRLEEGTCNWNYYNDKDIIDGYIVFDHVVNYFIQNGKTINDEIDVKYITTEQGIHYFVVTGCEVSDNSTVYSMVKIEIYCKDFYLCDKSAVIRD